MAVAAFAKRLDVLKRGRGLKHVLATYPAGHHAMQLARYSLIDFVPGKRKFTHGCGY